MATAQEGAAAGDARRDGWRSLGDEFAAFQRGRNARLTPHQRELLTLYYGMVDEWVAGRATLADIEANTSGYLRTMFLLSTPKNDPHYGPQRDLIEALWRKNRGPGMMTRHGFLTEDMIASQNGKLTEMFDPDTGLVELVAVFPTSYGKDMDGKTDFTQPIYGAPPRLYPPADPIQQYQRPTGYEAWNDIAPDDEDDDDFPDELPF